LCSHSSKPLTHVLPAPKQCQSRNCDEVCRAYFFVCNTAVNTFSWQCASWNCYLPIQLVCSANDPTFSDLKQGISKTKDSISIWLLMPFSLEWLGIELQQYLQAEENPYCSENSLHSKPPLMIRHMGNRFSRTKDRCSNSTSEKKTTKEHGKTCYCISCTWRTLKL
jgi:hypothetical protein